ncbi:hypothetical protein FVEG_02361 [Fusarium verticillioides 7600]|uniref:Uncharacterized protein n=1 Tax=Gibberella moniliformis (strain M3125 / FGSC 7600) TaxID=334819 RepID=W7LM20_GIBM7|nr:hypothetical protein FVEG_02361 [Fusarium verticillioides 7600]EWG39591.1 hypothetical protein FVEG_02361 [Fusarium verticillioides 7600]RBQ91678.1 hypothetical protein FVER53263_02361 [Fusarium verticillioides]
MLVPKISLLAVMAIPVAALNCQNEVADATIDRNWLLSGCGPCRKYPFPNNDADGFRYDEDNDATYKSICDVCRSDYGPRQPGRDDYGLEQPDKDTTSSTTGLSLPKETPTIMSSRTTQTKPRVGWLTPPGPDDGATFGSNDPQQPDRDDDGPKQPENDITSSIAALKHPKETLSITSIKITQTKPRVGWSTLPGPDDGTTLAWFTKTTTQTETETTTTTASTTVDLRKDTTASMSPSEATATSMNSAKSTATSMGLTETSATLDPKETDTPTPPKKNRSAGLQTAGIVMAVLFFILFTGLITWKCFLHRQDIQFDEGPEEPMGEAGGSAFDDSGSEADGRQARNLVVSVRDWSRTHQFSFPPPNEPEDPAPDDEEPGPRLVPPPPPIPERPVQAPVAAVHSNIPPTRPAIPRRQVRAPSVQVPTPDPVQNRSSSSVYSQDSGYPRSIEITRPLSIHRSHRTQEESQSPREWRTTGQPVPTEHYGWV